MGKLRVTEEDFQQAKRNAAKVGKIPVLGIKERGGARKRAILEWDDFVHLYWLARGERGPNE